MRRRNSKQKVDFTISTELSSPKGKLQDYSIMIYGEKKIGKTSMISHANGAYFCMFEPGGKALSIMQDQYRTWDKFKKAIPQILASKKIQNVVIDTADFAYKRCLQYTCNKLGIEHPQDLGYGKGWDAIKQELDSCFSQLLHSDKGIWFISHYTDRKITRADGTEYNRTSQTAPTTIREYLDGIVDMFFFYDYENSKRTLYVDGDDYISAGSRCENRFFYTNGEKIKKIDMGKSSAEAYENLVKAFSNKLEVPKITKGDSTKLKTRLKRRKRS